MAIYKNQDTGTWNVICWFTDWKGERKQKCKRGFPTKRAAADWEREFLMQKQIDSMYDKREIKKEVLHHVSKSPCFSSDHPCCDRHCRMLDTVKTVWCTDTAAKPIE